MHYMMQEINENFMDKIKLLNDNIKLVHIIARQFLNPSNKNFFDIISSGYESLWNAIENFEEAKCKNFNYYISNLIRNRIISELRKIYAKKRRINIKLAKSLFYIQNYDDKEYLEYICKDLTQEEKDVIFLIVNYDYNCSEIARKKSKHRNTVLATLNRGLSKLNSKFIKEIYCKN